MRLPGECDGFADGQIDFVLQCALRVATFVQHVQEDQRHQCPDDEGDDGQMPQFDDVR